MKGFFVLKGEILDKGSFPLNESKAADEGLYVSKRESLEKGSFPLIESRAADKSFLY